jgi:hypothetical protein
MKKTIRELFPLASQSTIDVNPDVDTDHPKVTPALPFAKRTAREMNKTEREFSFILEAQKRRGEISRWIFEGITLRWQVGEKIVRYTPDFIVFKASRMKLVEVKGGYIKGKFERAVERFRHARTAWPEFEFEMHQKQRGQWKLLA